MAGLLFLISTPPALAACGDKPQNNLSTFLQPYLSLAQKIANDFGIKAVLAGSPVPDNCGSHNVRCSGSQPVVDISWNPDPFGSLPPIYPFTCYASFLWGNYTDCGPDGAWCAGPSYAKYGSDQCIVVGYDSDGNPTYGPYYVYKNFGSTFQCLPPSFGIDPCPYIPKHCYVAPLAGVVTTPSSVTSATFSVAANTSYFWSVDGIYCRSGYGCPTGGWFTGGPQWWDAGSNTANCSFSGLDNRPEGSFDTGPISCCTDSSWSPDPSTVCSGQGFTQTSNCGNTRSAVGTENDTVWNPNPNTVCAGQAFTQTGATCGQTRGATGTNPSSPPCPPVCPDGSCNGTEDCNSCSQDCGACSLNVNFNAFPPSGPQPLAVTLTADITGGSAIGTINYTFWWNCANACTSVSSCTAACGDPTVAANGAKFDGVADDQKIVSNTYSATGTYTPKVIVERSTALAVTKTATVTVTSNPPTATNLNYTAPDYCTSPPGGTFSWTFSDPDAGDTQSAYEVQIADNSGFSAPLVDDSGKIANSASSYSPSVGKLQYNKTYYWRVMVWDSHDTASAWITGASFQTLPHAYPSVTDISWTPANPSAGESVTFSAMTVCYATGGGTVACPAGSGAPLPAIGYHWTFSGGNPGVVDGNIAPQVKFPASGSANASLKIVDADGYGASCSAPQLTKGLTVQLSLPGWKEVPPQ